MNNYSAIERCIVRLFVCLFVFIDIHRGLPHKNNHLAWMRKLSQLKFHNPKGYQIAKMPANPMKSQPVRAFCHRTSTTRKKKQLLRKLYMQKSREGMSHN